MSEPSPETSPDELSAEAMALELQELVSLQRQGSATEVTFDIHEAKRLILQDRETSIAKAFENLLLNATGSEYVKQLIEQTQKGVCANCGGDGHIMRLDGPAPCKFCDGTGRFKGKS